MKIGVVGTFIRDLIQPLEGPETRSIGGIFYTVAMLANLLSETDEIYPISYLGVDFYEQVMSRLQTYKNIKLDGIKRLNQKNTQHTLIYKSKQCRDEIARYPMPPLTFEDIECMLDAEVILVNFITGHDLSLDALKRLRSASDALFYVDYHSLTLGTTKTGLRYYRRPAHWKDWIYPATILQMNEQEAATLSGQKDTRSWQAFVPFGQELLASGPEIFNLTLGSNGSIVFCKRPDQFMVEKINPYPVDQVLDVTGCGDAFATGFIVNYLKTKDPGIAAQYANFIAGLNCTLVGTEAIPKLKELILKQNNSLSRLQ